MLVRSSVFTTLAAFTALLGASTAVASAAPLPTLGAAEGVQVVRPAKGIEVRFTGTAATAAARYVGRELTVACAGHPRPGLLFVGGDGAGGGGETTRVRRTADGVLALSTTLVEEDDDLPFDACTVERRDLTRSAGRSGPFTVTVGDDRPPLARAALTPAGSTWLDEVAVADRVVHLLVSARDGRYSTPAAAIAAHPSLVALDGPAATPPAGSVGYWSDGARHMAYVATSAAGRRLFLEDFGDGTLRGNLMDLLTDAFGSTGEARTYSLDLDRADRDATRARDGKAATAENGLRVQRAAQGLTVRFTGPAARIYRRIAGRRVTVICSQAAPLLLLSGSPDLGAEYRTAVVRVPRRGGVLRARMRPGAALDACAVSDDGITVAVMTPTAAGRALWQDLDALGVLFDTILAPSGATAYPAAATIVAKDPKRLVALAGPDAAVPVGKGGIWTSGAQAALVYHSRSGHRIVMADEGDGVLRSNIYSLADSAALLFSIE